MINVLTDIKLAFYHNSEFRKECYKSLLTFVGYVASFYADRTFLYGAPYFRNRFKSRYDLAVACFTISCFVHMVFFRISPLIHGFLSYSNGCFEQYKKEHQTLSKGDLPVMAILTAETDDNGSLRLDRRLFYQALEKKYRLVFRTIKHPDDINDELKNLGVKVDVLWFNAHGSSTAIDLSKTATLSRDDKTISSWKDKLAPDAVIVLEACSTGEETAGGNLAQKIARETGKTVYAAKKDVSPLSIRIQNLYPLKIRFFYLNFFNYFFMCGGEDMTCCIVTPQA